MSLQGVIDPALSEEGEENEDWSSWETEPSDPETTGLPEIYDAIDQLLWEGGDHVRG